MNGEEMGQPVEKNCDIDDMLCQLKVMNLLDGMKNLLGSEKFKTSYPEFVGLEETVAERMSQQKTTIKEAFEKCGLQVPEEMETASTIEEE